MHESDLDTLLVRIGNLDGVRAPTAEARERGRATLMSQIAGEGHTRPRAAGRRRGSRRAAVLVGVPLIVLALGAAGYAALSSSSSRLSDGIDCHLDQRLGGSGTVVGLDGRPATAICADAWRRGAVQDGTHRAPVLQACVDPAARGAIHVFASPDPRFCASVGLKGDPAAGSGPVAARFAALERDLEARFAATACVSPARAQQLAQTALDEHQAGSDWQILTGHSDATNPCMSLAIDSDAHTVRLTPIPRP
jgi:hypothetical protein